MVVPAVRLESNDLRMAGDYCQQKCMNERRVELPPYKDPRWDKKKVEEPKTKQVHEVHEVHEPMVIQEGIDQGFSILFGEPPKKAEEDEEESIFGGLFGNENE